MSEKDSGTLLIYNVKPHEQNKSVVYRPETFSRKIKIDSFLKYTSITLLVFGSIFTVGSFVLGLFLIFYTNNTTLLIFFSEFTFWAIFVGVVGIVFLCFGIILNLKRNKFLILISKFYQKNDH